MRMGVVLGLVAGAFVVCLAALSLVVFLARDEDGIQGDNLLAEEFTRAVALASQGDGVVDLRRIADFDWDRVLIVAPGTPREAISERLGKPWTGIDTVDGGDVLIFLAGDDVERFTDYRGNGRFEGFERPFAEVPREDAVFRVDSLVIRP
jgi:hypothetical protein